MTLTKKVPLPGRRGGGVNSIMGEVEGGHCYLVRISSGQDSDGDNICTTHLHYTHIPTRARTHTYARPGRFLYPDSPIYERVEEHVLMERAKQATEFDAHRGTHMRARTGTRTHSHTHTHTYTHAHIHTRTYTHAHTHPQALTHSLTHSLTSTRIRRARAHAYRHTHTPDIAPSTLHAQAKPRGPGNRFGSARVSVYVC